MWDFSRSQDLCPLYYISSAPGGSGEGVVFNDNVGCIMGMSLLATLEKRMQIFQLEGSENKDVIPPPHAQSIFKELTRSYTISRSLSFSEHGNQVSGQDSDSRLLVGVGKSTLYLMLKVMGRTL